MNKLGEIYTITVKAEIQHHIHNVIVEVLKWTNKSKLRWNNHGR